MLLVGLVSQILCLCSFCLLALPLSEHRTRAAFVLVLKADKSSLTLLLPCSQSGKLNMDAAAAKPKEDGFSGRRLPCIGGAFDHKALATSGLLVKKLLATDGLLAFVGSTLVKEALGGTLVKNLLTMSGLLSLTSSSLVKKALAGHCLLVMVFILPQTVQLSMALLQWQ
jgi:hypothetical protein